MNFNTSDGQHVFGHTTISHEVNRREIEEALKKFILKEPI